MEELRAARNRRVLVTGFRPAMADWLNRHGVPFAVWHDKPIRQLRKVAPGQRVIDRVAFESSPVQLRRQLVHQFGDMPGFTHVVAGTESGVVPAAVARMVVGLANRSNLRSAWRCHHKPAMKRFLAARGLPLVPWQLLRNGRRTWDFGERLGWPMVVKRAATSGGRGLFVANDRDELRRRAVTGMIVERFIDAPEVSVETIIRNGEIIFQSTTEYVVRQTVNIVPARLPLPVMDAIRDMNARLIEMLGIERGMTHAEFYVHADRFWFGEIGWRPPGGYIMELIEMAWGVDPWDLLMRVELELPLPRLDPRRASWAASVMVHPGPGMVETLDAGDMSSWPECRRMVFLAKPGRQLAPRIGSGEVAAYALFQSDDRERLLEVTAEACETLRVQLSGARGKS